MPAFSNVLNYILFADDTTGLHSSPSLQDLFTTVNDQANALQTWFSSNNLQMNATKTHLVLFTTRQREVYLPSDDVFPKFTLGSTSISLSSSVKFLGLQLDKNLTFKDHINFICKKISKGIYALSRAAKLLPTEDLKILYFSLILPYLNYGLLAWGGSSKCYSQYHELYSDTDTVSMSSLIPVHKLQKRALRVISKKGKITHHIPLCAFLEILDLEHLYCLRALSFFYDYYHENLPPFFMNKLIINHSRSSNILLKIQYRRTELASCTIFHTLPNIWNPLPEELKIEINKSKATFLKKVKHYYINKYIEWTCPEINCFVCLKGLKAM